MSEPMSEPKSSPKSSPKSYNLSKAPDFAAIASSFAAISDAQWRGLVDKALKGAPFERLVSRTSDGIEIQPLYPRDASGRAAVARAQGGP